MKQIATRQQPKVPLLPTVAEQAELILSTIDFALSVFQRFGFNLRPLPVIRIFRVDDGSILMEWIDNEFRIGFSIEPVQSDTSWYLVSDIHAESGYLFCDPNDMIRIFQLTILAIVLSKGGEKCGR